VNRHALPAGTRVVQDSGVRMAGIVSADTWPVRGCTDGTYREPHRHERPVYVAWGDGTRGWVNRPCVREEGGVK
jgi:hypothetical protein